MSRFSVRWLLIRSRAARLRDSQQDQLGNDRATYRHDAVLVMVVSFFSIERERRFSPMDLVITNVDGTFGPARPCR